MKIKFIIAFLLLTLSVSVYGQALLVVNEDSTHTHRIKPRQFIECLVLNGANRPTVLRGRLKLFYANSFVLETQQRQWASVYLADLIAVRRISRRAAWPMMIGGGTFGGSGATTQRASPASVIGAAVVGAGIATLGGDFSPAYYRWSVYRGWQFRLVSSL